MKRLGYSQAKPFSRRIVLRGGAAAGITAAVAGLIGCGSSNTSKNTASPAGGGATSTAATAAAQASAAAAVARSSTPAALDSTKGKPGGNFTFQGAGSSGTSVTINNNDAGFTHSGLLAYSNGRPGFDPLSIASEPDLAQAMPEQPDPLTYTFKLRNAKFHNGTPVTSADVKYSFDRFATGKDSVTQSNWQAWYSTVETPDPQTAVVKSKVPFADAIASMTIRTDAYIMSQTWEESADGPTKLMGSGPFLFVDIQQPIQMRFKRNPDYFLQPYPYFDQLTVLTMTDPTKKISDFITHQILMTYYFPEDERDQIKQSRSDAVLWAYAAPAFNIQPRVDQAPFNDLRVRQALALTVDRKAIRQAVSKGEGEEDQVFSMTGKVPWGYRKPSELGANYKYWSYDPQTAKQLMSAAGISQPIQTSIRHYDATVNRPFADAATLIAANWQQLGFTNLKDIPVTFGQYATTVGIGNYDGIALTANAGLAFPDAVGPEMKAELGSPADGVKTPTKNLGHINDAQLSALADKQITQINPQDRVQTFHQMEDIMAAQQYRIALSTFSYNYFTDPSLRNVQLPRDMYGGGIPYVKYWWFA